MFGEANILAQEVCTVELLLENWLTAAQAQALTGYAIEHLYRLARAGTVEARKLGQMWLFNRESLLAHRARARPGRKPRSTTD